MTQKSLVHNLEQVFRQIPFSGNGNIATILFDKALFDQISHYSEREGKLVLPNGHACQAHPDARLRLTNMLSTRDANNNNIPVKNVANMFSSFEIRRQHSIPEFRERREGFKLMLMRYIAETPSEALVPIEDDKENLLHTISLFADEDLATSLISKVGELSQEHQARIYVQKNEKGSTPLNTVMARYSNFRNNNYEGTPADKKNNESYKNVLRCFIETVPLMELLRCKEHEGSLLHRVVELGNSELVRVFINRLHELPVQEITRSFSFKNIQGQTVLVKAKVEHNLSCKKAVTKEEEGNVHLSF